MIHRLTTLDVLWAVAVAIIAAIGVVSLIVSIAGGLAWRKKWLA